MAIYVSDFKVLDPLWEGMVPFEDLVVIVMRELTNLNPQGHVHAQELYAAVNLVRRIPHLCRYLRCLQADRGFIHVAIPLTSVWRSSNEFAEAWHPDPFSH